MSEEQREVYLEKARNLKIDQSERNQDDGGETIHVELSHKVIIRECLHQQDLHAKDALRGRKRKAGNRHPTGVQKHRNVRIFVLAQLEMRPDTLPEQKSWKLRLGLSVKLLQAIGRI
ncbi:unnamed protein product [Rhizophagus irregularis]|nr:unnamed protein product [Rhizophagus irregularis]